MSSPEGCPEGTVRVCFQTMVCWTRLRNTWFSQRERQMSHTIKDYLHYSEAWGPPQFQEKRSRSENAILRALGEFLGYSRSSSRNSKFHSRNTKFHSRNGIPRLEQYETTILGATPGATPGIDGNPHERFSFL